MTMTTTTTTKETKAQRVERLKRSRNPWDGLEEIRRFAREGFDSIPPEWLGTYFRWWGVYTQGDGLGAVRVHGPRAWDDRIVIDWRFTDLGQTYRTTLRNGVLTHRVTDGEEGADLTLTLTKLQMVGMLTGKGFDQIGHEGDLAAIGRLIGVLNTPDRDFPDR